MKNALLTAAERYIKNGINVIAVDGSKTAIDKWTVYQSRMITVGEIASQLSKNNAKGLAIICGAVSGGLEVMDVDLKNDISGDLWPRLVDKLKESELYDLFKVARTKNGGYHLCYRCEVVEPNHPVATRPKTDEEKINNPANKGIVLIETRGERGYIVAAPSDGYEWISGTMQVISIEQRDLLFEICRSFNEFLEAPKHSRYTKVENRDYGLSPFEDYNKRGDVVALLEKHGWTVVRDNGNKVIFKRPGKSDSKTSGDFNRDLNWFSVFTTNSAFETNKAYQPYAVYAVLECNGNFSEAAKKLIEDGYGEKRQKYGEKMEKEIFKMKSEGAPKLAVVNMLKSNYKKDDKEAIDIIETLERQWGKEVLTFWDVNANTGKIKINNYRLQKYLSNEGGFYRFSYDKDVKIAKLVRIKDGKIELTSIEEMKTFIKDFVLSLPDSFDGGLTPETLMEIILTGQAAYFNEALFEFMEPIDPYFLKSEKGIAYFPFNNGVVVIKDDQISLKSYSELNRTVWRNQVINFDIVIDQEFSASKSEFYEFLTKISGDNEARLKYCVSIIGYLLHGYKDASRPYAIILAEETENNEDGGGTGKGIFVKALSKLLRTLKLDGKNFKIDSTFAFQQVTLDTQLIALEDCNKNLDFELFNSQITEGSSVEKKNLQKLTIDYKDSPKFIFSTNYMLNIKGNHGRRRSRVFEFSPFFGPDKTPVDHFGHLLFDDWDRDEWIRFYNVMFYCVKEYLEFGIVKMEQTDVLKRKTIRTSYGDEFLEWFVDFTMPEKGNLGVPKMQMELYNNFVGENGYSSKDYSVKRFRSGIISACKLLNLAFESKKVVAGKQVTVGKSEKSEVVPDNVSLMPDFEMA